MLRQNKPRSIRLAFIQTRILLHLRLSQGDFSLQTRISLVLAINGSGIFPLKLIHFFIRILDVLLTTAFFSMSRLQILLILDLVHLRSEFIHFFFAVLILFLHRPLRRAVPSNSVRKLIYRHRVRTLFLQQHILSRRADPMILKSHSPTVFKIRVTQSMGLSFLSFRKNTLIIF